MKKLLWSAAVLTLVGGQLHANVISWTDWTTVADDAGTTVVTGVLDVNGTDVTVEYRNPNGLAFVQTAGGTDYWAQAGGGRDPLDSPYTSVGPNGVDNIPTGTDIVALNQMGMQTLTFSQAISDVYFSFVSLNVNGYGFDRDFEILSGGGQDFDGNGTDDCGFWGCGTSYKEFNLGEYQLLGTGEPHGTILLDGSFSTLSWRSLSAENWNGFTIGVAGLAPPIVPLPAAGLLLAAGLGALGAARARRRT